MSEYSCKPSAYFGCYIVTIDFDEPRVVEGKATRGIRGFYRARTIGGHGYQAAPMVIEDPAHLLAAIADLEGMAT